MKVTIHSLLNKILNPYIIHASIVWLSKFYDLYYRSGSTCGGTLYANTTMKPLTSPSYPRLYQPNLRCVWTIEAPENEQVEITVTVLDLVNQTNCVNEYLELTDTAMVSTVQSINALSRQWNFFSYIDLRNYKCLSY